MTYSENLNYWHSVAQQRRSITVHGTVQGVGFRPFVYQLAVARGLSGWVRNDGRRVEIEAEGPPDALADFEAALQIEAPPLATIARVQTVEMPVVGAGEFRILDSEQAGPGLAAIPPDIAPCSHCLDEIGDRENRRFGYPFTCCTDCGPRYTVIRGLPYDRKATSMAPFDLCDQCQTEYRDPTDRRFHAQATCCATCGPTLDAGSGLEGGLGETVRLLRDGAIVAVKGLGGYQLMCRADLSESVRALRQRKRREEKPFAVLVGSLEAANRLVQLDSVGERGLAGPEAPIVLAPVQPRSETAARTAAEVAPGTGLLGVMLPSSPLHRLLVDGVGAPLVCTSGNLSDEPIITEDAAARRRLGPITDAILGHDRAIERRADDSVGQVVLGRFQLLRRARGYAPRPISLGQDGPPVLAVGAELKSTVCLALDSDAAVSVHLGDLENPETLAAFEEAVADQLALTGVKPELVVHDLHPEYLSTKFARSQDLAPTLAVQHHHAHLAACLADNGYPGPAIGVTFDGLGWGTDDTAWGGEVLVGDAAGYRRAAHLKPVALPGGVAALREPWRMALAHWSSSSDPANRQIASVEELPPLPCFTPSTDAVSESVLSAVFALCRSERSPVTSSMGRLFDAVAALCGITVGRRSANGAMAYEGQAAIGLEQLAMSSRAISSRAVSSSSGYRWQIDDGEPMVVDSGPVVRAISDDLVDGRPPAEVAARFHRSVAELIGELCAAQREITNLTTVALTGGVFQNRLLVELSVPLLEARGFSVLRHAQVPPNDGGISLGQAAVGRAHLAGM